MSAESVRIVARPIGEAPEWVRDAWVGLSLPLLCPDQRRVPGVGVLSGPHFLLGQLVWRLLGRSMTVSGYIVNAGIAVDLLEAHHPQAAGWWRANAGHLLDRSRNFVFDTPSCELER